MSELTINSVCEFLHASGSQFTIIDMGRGFRVMSEQTFLDIEYQRLPAPFPRQQHIWIGCIFWNPSLSAQHFIWFLKLPLDERGLLNQAARNMFLEKVIQALGAELEKSEAQNGQLGDNPFTFVPTQAQLAMFNAIAKQQLGLALDGAKPAIAYITAPEQHDWQVLSLQALAEVTVQQGDASISALLQKQLFKLAPVVQKTLLENLEHVALHKPLAVLIHKQLHLGLADYPKDEITLHTCIRALTRAPLELQQQACKSVLAQSSLTTDTLILLSARWMEALADHNLMLLFLTHLSVQSDDIFAGLYQDLVQVPCTRAILLPLLQDKNIPTAIQTKLSSIFGQRL